MADPVEVYISSLRGTGGELDGLATRIDGILSRVAAASQAHWGRWGADEFGTSFAEGEQGYSASDKNLQAVVASKVSLLQSYSSALVDAANRFQTAEQANKDGLG
ncbi:hypothetical protein NN3_59180 [Nocardia neocaledoniensis NBRC 108232]|uniref:WXG100 family type VII secretion target n=1 Tax=Nocardia neocaledoniensis TaxID=236511 RepID=A0A317NQZ8_9NOCA|nr:hypothetical protein [Nocardia neocaledoniensis]PWV77699.1 hypothetical protein DFR69_103298 [Nocardia neocaledoniensis]GEM34911.1 hypothetical protein NN3_59180 [Nocardia neocaledoniensis NBRC 108232]